MNKAGVLIVDDENSLRSAIKMGLDKKYRVFEASSGSLALEKVLKEEIDVVLLDIRLPDTTGIELIEKIRSLNKDANIIMLTADNTVRTAVKTMKLGAYDYLTKPFDMEDLNFAISKALEKKLLDGARTDLSPQSFRESRKLLGSSKQMRGLLELIEQVAKSDSTVLISGQTGTGKELVARAVHQSSKRAKMPFVPVNCAGIPENLLESELFGHERGAFTGALERHTGKFELASGGTLFLDEVSSLPMMMQGKLLRSIQERSIERVGGEKQIQVDLRLIAATNSDLKKAVEAGSFREDLYYRLNVIPVSVPPLKEREGDIEELCLHFIKKFNRVFKKNLKGLSPKALQLLKSHDWPGNIRELENLMERLVVLGKGPLIEERDLPFEISKDTTSMSLGQMENLSFKEATARFESELIEKAIRQSGGKKALAAQKLGIHRNTLSKLEQKLKKK
ncbi:MAG: sigma-54 dependent transcriptional regulator [Candidatus Margulisiibacteriota bacterium]